MATFMKKVSALVLVLCMLIGMMPLQALAEEEIASAPEAEVTLDTSSENPVVVLTIEPKNAEIPAELPLTEAPQTESKLITEENAVESFDNVYDAPATEVIVPTEENVDIDVNSSESSVSTSDEEGNEIVTETIVTETEGTIGDATITGSETYTETTVINPDGEVIQNVWVQEGSEVVEIVVDNDTGNEIGQPEVTIELKPGETTVATAGDKTVITGDTSGSVYDYTVTTTADRKVEATATENEVKIEVAGTSDMKPLIPDRSIDDDGDLKDEQLLKEYTYSGGFEDYAPVAAPEGYDYRFTGFGQMSMYGNAIIAADGSEGRTGALQFELEYDPDFVPGSSDNKVVTEDERFLAYCADINTDGKDNWWYRIDSLEDSGYYDEEAAGYIRAIALNGYWGTSNEPDEEGNLQSGSLAKLKADMKAAVAAGTLTGITEEEIDSLTEGQALNATQSAIWTYANETTEGSKVDPERMITMGYAANRAERVDPSEEDVRNAKAVYSFLTGLAPMEKGEHQEVIDEDAFIREDSMSLTIGDKVQDAEANADDNIDNDVYNVDLNFALVVTPSEEGDDLVVQVITGFEEDGTPIIAAQGRIAGGSAEEDAANGFNDVSFDEKTGTYTLSGLQLAENESFDFDLKLVGTQHLEQGVYIFTSEIRDNVSSQTFVSVLEGEKEVNVSRGYEICFNVTEQTTIIAERNWRDTNDPVYSGEEDEDPQPRARYRLTRGVGQLETLIDEEVPLAEVPQTGDISILWFALIALSGLGLCLISLSEKKCRA